MQSSCFFSPRPLHTTPPPPIPLIFHLRPHFARVFSELNLLATANNFVNVAAHLWPGKGTGRLWGWWGAMDERGEWVWESGAWEIPIPLYLSLLWVLSTCWQLWWWWWWWCVPACWRFYQAPLDRKPYPPSQSSTTPTISQHPASLFSQHVNNARQKRIRGICVSVCLVSQLKVYMFYASNYQY